MNTKHEIWKPVVGFEQTHEVSSRGVVRRVGGKVIKGFLMNTGYISVRFSRAKQYSVHRLVCDAFLGTRPKPMQVDHIDGNKTNNNLSNLRWVTPKENSVATWVRRTEGRPAQRGEKHCFAKINTAQASLVCHMKTMRVRAGWQTLLAGAWGVQRCSLSDIATGRNWARAIAERAAK